MNLDDDELGSRLDALVEETRCSGVVRVDRPGAAPIELAHGLADRRWRVANTASTRFAVASITKGVTALVVAALAERGVLALDAPARAWLGTDLPLVDDAVTLEHLLGHRSGIGDYLDESAGGAIDDYVMAVPVHRLDATEAYLEVLDGHPQIAAPGDRFAYNNSGYVVLALVAERAARRRFADLVDELVCHPAGLTDTSFDRTDSPRPGTATGYLGVDGSRTNALHLPVVGSGDGGLVSTTADLARLWWAFADGAIVGGELRDRMLADEHATGYGLGFWLHPGGAHLEGYDAGVSSWSARATDGTVASVVSNTSEGAWPIARYLADIIGLDG